MCSSCGTVAVTQAPLYHSSHHNHHHQHQKVSDSRDECAYKILYFAFLPLALLNHDVLTMMINMKQKKIHRLRLLDCMAWHDTSEKRGMHACSFYNNQTCTLRLFILFLFLYKVMMMMTRWWTSSWTRTTDGSENERM